MGNGDPKTSITDMKLHAGGVLGELVYEVREQVLNPARQGMRDALALGPPPEPPEPPPPPPPPKNPGPLKDLAFELHVIPYPAGVAGDRVTILAEVFYKGLGTDGKPGRWPYPDKWVDILFQEKVHQGAGPFPMELHDVGKYKVVLRAIADRGRTFKLSDVVVTSVCGARLPSDPDQRDLVCLLFSEGGSMQKPQLDDRELRAVAWTLRNRFDALTKAKAENHARHWNFLAGRWFKEPNQNVGLPISAPLTYRSMMRGYKQFTGVVTREFSICEDPLRKVESIGTCKRVQKCIDTIDAVMSKGQPPDPYEGRGNPDYPGVFYYKVKGNTPPHDGPMLPELTGHDHHFYQGLDPEFRP